MQFKNIHDNVKTLIRNRLRHPHGQNSSDYSHYVQINFHKNKLLRYLDLDRPFFVMDPTIFKQRLTGLRNALAKHFPVKTGVYYSLKTNYQLASTPILTNNKVGAEVVSGWEYDFAIKNGFPSAKLIFNGPIKTEKELITALDGGATIHLDTWTQIQQMVKLASEGFTPRRTNKIGIRLKTHPNSRFGYDIDNGEATQAIRALYKVGINVASLHHHPGTDIYSPSWRYQGAKLMAEWFNSLPERYKTTINQIDIGGGYPAHATYPYGGQITQYESTDINDHIRAIKLGLDASPQLWKQIKSIITEPGRLLVEDCIIYITQVVDVTHFANQQIVLTNGSITQLPVAYYRSQIVEAFGPHFDEKKTSSKTSTQVFGGTCKEDDKLFTGDLPEVTAGDILIFYAVGAYNQSMESAFIFPAAKFYMLDPHQNYE